MSDRPESDEQTEDGATEEGAAESPERADEAELAPASPADPEPVAAEEAEELFEEPSADSEPAPAEELGETSEEEEPAPLPGEDDEEGPGLERSLHLPAERRKSVIESLIFVANQPITERQIAQRLGLTPADVRPLVEELIADYEVQGRGVRIDRISGGLQFRTAVDNAAFVREMMAPKPVRMTRAQLETLSIVAYRQPVTRPEIDEIRGVDSGAALKLLADRELIRVLGRKEEPGRPLLYGTTAQFLEFFGLNSIRDLPTLKEFSELSEESRALFERRIGEPLDLRTVAEEAKAAEEAMQNELLSQDPEDEDLPEEDIEEPSGGDEEPSGDGEEPPGDGEEPSGGDEEPSGDGEEPSGGDEESPEEDEDLSDDEEPAPPVNRTPLSDDFDDDDFDSDGPDDDTFENPDFDGDDEDADEEGDDEGGIDWDEEDEDDDEDDDWDDEDEDEDEDDEE